MKNRKRIIVVLLCFVAVLATVSAQNTFMGDDLPIVAGFVNGFKWVDLGLPSGTRWATCNIGATKPEEYGDYFAWGEVKPKEVYDKSTYEFSSNRRTSETFGCDVWSAQSMVYESYGYYGYLYSKYDAAAVNMGCYWRMPTDLDWCELKSKCTWTWTTLRGVNGYKVKGPNGNTIFLPAAGFRCDSDLVEAASVGKYWSRSVPPLTGSTCYYLNFNSNVIDCDTTTTLVICGIGDNYKGFSVRGVYK